MIVILHNIRSAHNVGSILRTSDGAGVEKVYLCGFSPTPLNKIGGPKIRVTKVALGAENFVEWEQAKSTTALIDRLKKQNYKIYAVEQTKNSIPYFKEKIKSNDKMALVMGNEVNGLTGGIIKRADKVLEIPMYGEKKSLNVSVAFGIVAYHLKTNK